MIKIDGNQLTIKDVHAAAHAQSEVALSNTARGKMAKSRGWVEEIVKKGKPVYGINTGFGIFANKKISPEDTAKLNRNLILSHAVGVGANLPDEVVCAAMLIRANTLSGGYSGVRPVIVETLLEMLNKGVTPLIPAQGSLGSSGDLAPLSHMALVLSTDQENREEDSGWAKFEGKEMSGQAAMRKAKINRVVLEAKEGLGITNGATFSAALAALCIYSASMLLETANIAISMSLEALLGASAAFDARLHEARKQLGQISVAKNIRQLIEGSTLINATERVQDAYSLRCAPQVHGAVVDTLKFVEDIIGREINAATDNPLLFGADDAISGGNFHGEPVGLGMDYLKIGMAEIGAISERRIFHLTDGNMNAGLPPMLVDDPEEAGVNSGLMMPQYTAASLVLENQSLASANSIHSLPTSGGKEDHNANSMTAARNAWQVIENVSQILATEIYTATRALDLRMREMPNAKMGMGTSRAHAMVRKIVPYQAGDAWWKPEIQAVHELLISGDFTKAVGILVDT